MNLKKIFLLNIFIILMAVSAFSVLGVGCDVSKSPKILYPSYDFYHEGKSARATVFGEATNGNFNSETKVIVDCNVDNKQPAPLEKHVTARIIAYTQSTLAYSSYCYYPQSSTDVEYQVSAVIMPGDTECANTESSGILSKGSGAKTTPITTPAPKSIKDPEIFLPSPPAVPETDSDQQEQTIVLELEPKWNLIGFPLDPTKIESTCKGKITSEFYYDAANKKYVKHKPISSASGALQNDPKPGYGSWVNVKERCVVWFKGYFKKEQTLKLSSGWNLVSVQTDIYVKDKNNAKTTCEYQSPFWAFDTNVKQYVKHETLMAGKGYWVKVRNNCELIVSENDQPPLPPGA